MSNTEISQFYWFQIETAGRYFCIYIVLTRSIIINCVLTQLKHAHWLSHLHTFILDYSNSCILLHLCTLTLTYFYTCIIILSYKPTERDLYFNQNKNSRDSVRLIRLLCWLKAKRRQCLIQIIGSVKDKKVKKEWKFD